MKPAASSSLAVRFRAALFALFARTSRRPDGTGVIVERARGGRVLSRTRFERGRPHGPAEAWWPGGAKRSHGQHKDGVRDGEWFEFQPDGALDRARTGLYRDGLRIGGIRGFNEWLGSP